MQLPGMPLPRLRRSTHLACLQTRPQVSPVRNLGPLRPVVSQVDGFVTVTKSFSSELEKDHANAALCQLDA